MQLILSTLQKLVGKDNIILTPSGDHAIKAVFSIIKGKKCLIPDQGGWLSYKKTPIKSGYEIEEVKTDCGVIDLSDLKEKVTGADVFIYQNPAGYFAEQDAKSIYDACRGKCIVILDITGCIGSGMYNPKYCDIVVCSFGKWKPIDIGYGGFFGFDDVGYVGEALKFGEFDSKYGEKLMDQISKLNTKYSELNKITEKIKNDLSGFQIIHRNKNGINVITKFSSEKEKENLINYCRANRLEFTLCPRYIRVLENAVSIEVKRLKVV